MALVYYDEIDGVSVGATELSIISGTTSLQTVTDDLCAQLFLDPAGAAMAKGDEFKWRIYEKVEATGGTKRVVLQGTMSDVNVQPIITPPLLLKHGWDMTLQKIAGTDRNWDASIRGTDGTISEPYELDGVTVTNTELSIPNGGTTLQSITDDGVYQLWIDPLVAPMAKADEFLIKIKEKVEGTGGTQRVIYEATLLDTQAELFVSPMFILMEGWDMTMQRISATSRAFDASVRKIG